MKTIKQYYEKLKSGKPGRRFLGFYEYRRAHRSERSKMSRVLPIVVGVLLLGFGMAIGWLPGPGGFIGIIGLAILGAEIRPLAVLLDIVERFLYRVWLAFRRRWQRDGTLFRAGTVLSATVIAGLFGWAVVQVLWN